MSSKSRFTFSDLFAGIGGFHAALHAAGGDWVFASEIDPDAQAVYDYNWLRPLRERAPSAKAAARFQVSGDIVPLTDPDVAVPHADVLAAGFPCQPFSKSGLQRGMAETRGTLFWNIARILQEERTRPSVVLLENVRNLAGPRHRDTTFKTIVTTLRQLGYRTADRPAVFSPHLLPRELGGRPQVRERVFILAHYVGPDAAQDRDNFDDPIVSPRSLELEWSKDRWDLAQDLPLQPDIDVDDKYKLESAELKMIDTWNRSLTEVAARLEPGERLPGFPIWYDDFRSIDEAEDLIEAAEFRGEPLPAWKRDFLRKNATFFERHHQVIQKYQPMMDSFPASRRKFEWQAGPHRPLSETIMHFRPSGIRAKRPDYVPALVAITQTSILGDRRRLTPRETARLQGLPDWFEFKRSSADGEAVLQRDAASYKQMGNGVNVGAAYYVFRRYVLEHASDIAAVSPQVVKAVLASPDSPDKALAHGRPGDVRTVLATS
jgi:DNA (cytosine-5)-methyltransferase 1